MNLRMRIGLGAIAVVAAAVVAAAQTRPEVTLPPSPRGSAAIQVGGSWTGTGTDRRYTNGKWITIDYGRPIMRGRENIFGSGADYGKTVNPDAAIWRAGANDSTRLTTQATLVFGGKAMEPGVYNVLVDLKEGAWTFVLSTQPIQPKYNANDKVLLYGAYNYDPKFDVLRAPMTVRTSDTRVEQLTIGFVNVTATSATLLVTWETTTASIDLKLANGGTH